MSEETSKIRFYMHPRNCRNDHGTDEFGNPAISAGCRIDMADATVSVDGFNLLKEVLYAPGHQE